MNALAAAEARLVARGLLHPNTTFTACSIQERHRRFASVDETTAGASGANHTPAVAVTAGPCEASPASPQGEPSPAPRSGRHRDS